MSASSGSIPVSQLADRFSRDIARALSFPTHGIRNSFDGHKAFGLTSQRRTVTDKYRSYSELQKNERQGTDYRIRVVDRGSSVVVVAPHGGEIEPGSSEIAASIAGDTLSLYCFEGLVLDRKHGDLHLASERFDEPKGDTLARQSDIVVGITVVPTPAILQRSGWEGARQSCETLCPKGEKQALRATLGAVLSRFDRSPRTIFDVPIRHRGACGLHIG